MDSHHKEKATGQIQRLASAFINLESNHQSLITVTRATLAPDGSQSTIYISVLPESTEEQALHFLRRKRSEFKQYVREHSRLRRIPFFEFQLDVGEKHRQRLDELTRTAV